MRVLLMVLGAVLFLWGGFLTGVALSATKDQWQMAPGATFVVASMVALGAAALMGRTPAPAAPAYLPQPLPGQPVAPPQGYGTPGR